MRTERPTIKAPFEQTIYGTHELAKVLCVEEGELIAAAERAPYSYSSFWLPKKTGGFRPIRPPGKHLRFIQRRILRALEPRVRYPRWMMGGVPRRSILKHALPHVGQTMVATLDLESFFPSVKAMQVSFVFERFAIGGPALEALVRLTTLDDQLPQGSPVSCFLANLVIEPIDRRVHGLCRRHGLNFTRYIDDLAISGDRDLRSFRSAFTEIVECSGFTISAKKPIRFMNRRGPQEVTNLIVNDKMRPTKKYIVSLKNDIWECLRGAGPKKIALEHGVCVSRLKARMTGRVSYISTRNLHKPIRFPFGRRFAE